MDQHSTGVGRRSARLLLVAVAGVLGALLLAAPGVAGAPTVGCENRTNNTYDKLLGCVTLEGVREHQAALRRYEVAFASTTGRGELGEQVLVETARALGLREGLHFELQTDLAGGGAVRPDMVLLTGGGRRVPVDAKTTLACWAEAVETDDPEERAEALRVHVRNIRSRAAELSARNYQRWADAIYGTIMFVPSDAAVVTALDTDPNLLRWLLDRRVFLCGPTGCAVVASAAGRVAGDIERADAR